MGIAHAPIVMAGPEHGTTNPPLACGQERIEQ